MQSGRNNKGCREDLYQALAIAIEKKAKWEKIADSGFLSRRKAYEARKMVQEASDAIDHIERQLNHLPIPEPSRAVGANRLRDEPLKLESVMYFDD
jgi:hypothetical protein